MTAILLNQNISKTTEKLNLNSELADVHFIFNIDGDGEIHRVPGHKLILAMNSSVFKAMFFGPLKEQGDIEIVDADSHAFKEFLKLFYLSNVMLSMECMEAVTRLADKYDVMDCIEEMCKMLLTNRLTSKNVFYIYQLAIYADHFPLIKACEQLISDSSCEIFQIQQFLRIDKKILTCVLEMRLKCREIDVIYGCLKWAIYACGKQKCERNGENIRAELDDCLQLIRFCKLNLEQVTYLDANYVGLFTPEEFKDIVLMQKVSKYEPKIFNRYDRRYEWNADQVLLCNRKVPNFEQSSAVNHPGPEVITFTSNKPVLLGEIHINARLVELNVSLEIIESRIQNSKNEPTTIYRDAFQAEANHSLIIHTYKPVLIKPHILYEIRVRIQKNCVSGKCKSTVDLQHDIKIEFHRNMTLPYDNAANGCIASLGFNQIL